MKFKLVCILTLCALSLTSFAFTQNHPESIRLEFKGKSQDVNYYVVKMTGISQITNEKKEKRSANMLVDIEIKQKILNVSVNGTLDMSTVVTKGNSTVNGVVTELPNVGQTLLMKLSRRGKVLKVQGDIDKQQVDLESMQITFPDRRLVIGDSWISKVKVNPNYPVPMEAKYTLEGFTNIGGYSCAVIQTDIYIKSNNPNINKNMKVNASGKIYFDYKLGKIIKNTLNTKMFMKVLTSGPKAKKRTEITMDMDLNMEINLR